MDQRVNNLCGLSGYVDLLLVDKKTQKVVKHIRKRNNLTEPFARWLLMGNLGIPNPASIIGNNAGTAKNMMVSNPVSRLLGSNAKYLYQACTSSCGTGNEAKYGVYLLSEPALVDAHTQIPPYFNASLNALSDRRRAYADDYDPEDPAEIDMPLVVFYGTEATMNDGILTMAMDDGNSCWGKTLTNPSFTTTYVKNDGYAKIHSVVLGACPAQLVASGQPATFDTRQSTSVVLKEWDTTWATATESSTSFMQSNSSASYLICPYARQSQVSGHFGDGLYAPTPSATSYLTYYDLASKQYERNTAADTAKQNMLSGDCYSTAVSSISGILGGFVLGGTNNETRILRVDASGGVSGATSRAILLQYSANWGDSSTNGTLTLATLQTTDAVLGVDENDEEITARAVLPFANNAPVMVAKRGASAANDTLEIFVSMGVGEFREYSDDAGVHPGGIGIEIHKLSIAVSAFRTSGNTADLSRHLTNHGRVAVLPYAIGQAVTTPSNLANYYCVGAYLDGEYFLPFTHLLQGCSPHDWSYNDNVPNARRPIYCCTTGYQPGMVLDDSFQRQRDFLFGANGERRTILTTDDGPTPVVVNQTQHWACSLGSVISGVSLDTPIIKEENQILVVRYTYTLDIMPEIPDTPTLTLATQSISAIQIHWTTQGSVARYRLQRVPALIGNGDFTNAENVVTLPVPPPSMTATPGVYVDSGLLPNRRYVYRLCAANGGGSSLWGTAAASTDALTTQVADPAFVPGDFLIAGTMVRLKWQWDQPTLSPYFLRYEIRYKATGDEEYTTVSDAALDTAATSSCEIRDLTPSTEYTFELRALLPPEYYSAEDELCSQSSWVTTTLSTLAAVEPTVRTDFAVYPYDLVHTQAGTSYGRYQFTWTPEADFQYDVRMALPIAGYTDVATGISGTALQNVLTLDDESHRIPYDTWRATPSGSPIRLLPYNSAYPKTDAAAQSAISESPVAFYRLGYRGVLPQIVTSGTASNWSRPDGTRNVWSNSDNLLTTDDSNAVATWRNIGGAAVETEVNFNATIRHRTATTGAMHRYPLVGWKVDFHLARTMVYPDGDVATASDVPDISARLRVRLIGIQYTAVSAAAASPVIESEDLLDEAVFAFANNQVVSTANGAAFARILSFAETSAYDAFRIDFDLCTVGENDVLTPGFTSYATPESHSDADDDTHEQLTLSIKSVDLISSLCAAENIS